MKNTTVWLVLILFTLLATIIPNNYALRYIIIGLFTIKFLLVAFNFMEIKEAHVFWKIIVSLLVLVFNSIIVFI